MNLIKLQKRILADRKRLEVMGTFYQKTYEKALKEVHTFSEEGAAIVSRLSILIQALGTTTMITTRILPQEENTGIDPVSKDAGIQVKP